MTTKLSPIIPGTTKNFTVSLQATGLSVNDTVTFRIKRDYQDTDSNALVTKTADSVVPNGSAYIASFVLTPSDTEPLTVESITRPSVGMYYDITWDCVSGERYVIPTGGVSDSAIEILQRVSDI